MKTEKQNTEKKPGLFRRIFFGKRDALKRIEEMQRLSNKSIADSMASAFELLEFRLMEKYTMLNKDLKATAFEAHANSNAIDLQVVELKNLIIKNDDESTKALAKIHLQVERGYATVSRMENKVDHNNNVYLKLFDTSIGDMESVKDKIHKLKLALPKKVVKKSTVKPTKKKK